MYPSRKGFRFQVPPTDPELWAIGMVTVQWSLLETMLQSTVHAITKGDPVAKNEFDSLRSFKIRLAFLETLLRERMQPTYAASFLALVTRIRDLQFMRDRIVHGTWSGNGPDHEMEEPKSTVFNWAAPRRRYEWSLNFGKIKEVAVRIESVNAEWQSALIGSANVPKDEMLLLSSILQGWLRPEFRVGDGEQVLLTPVITRSS